MGGNGGGKPVNYCLGWTIVAVSYDVCFGGIWEGSPLIESLGSEDGVELDSPGVSLIGEYYEGIEVCFPSGL